VTDRDALLAAIRAQPEEDTPRLALADWLDEFGDTPAAEWAALIRLQIAVARSEVGSEEHAEAVWREAQHNSESLARWRAEREARGIPIWDLHSGPRFSWVGPLPPDIVVGTFERGMPTSVGRWYGNYTDWTLTPDHRKGIAAVAKLFPVTRLVTPLSGRTVQHPGGMFGGQRRELELLAAWPTLEKFTALDIGHGGYYGEDQSAGLHALAASPFAANLTELGLCGSTFDSYSFRAVVTSRLLWKLDTIAVRPSPAENPDVFRPLIGSPFAGRCRSLTAEGAGVWPDVVADVVARGRVERLSLNVDGFQPGDFGTALAGIDGRKLAKLRSLRLAYDGPAQLEDRSPSFDEVTSAAGLLAFLSSPHLTELSELALEGFELRELGLAELLRSPAARRVRSLELRRCALDDACVPRLRPLLAGGRLRKLSLADNELTFDVATELASWPELRQLHDLELPGLEMGSEALDAVEQSPHAHPFLMLSE
jgi:uncharacterized protein (TIGR02996 family)